MQRSTVVLRPSTINDLEGLANYIIEMHGLPRTALDYIELIQLRCAALGEFAFAGRRRDDLRCQSAATGLATASPPHLTPRSSR